MSEPAGQVNNGHSSERVPALIIVVAGGVGVLLGLAGAWGAAVAVFVVGAIVGLVGMTVVGKRGR